MSSNRARIALIGSRWLGAEVLRALQEAGYQMSLIAPSRGDRAASEARRLGVPVTVKPDHLPLQTCDFPTPPDLIVCAHSFRIVPAWIISRARLGAIGYHPSLLPEFKGRRSVEDAIRAGVRITGGTVYWLTDQVDGGPTFIARGTPLQRTVQILPNETAFEVWRRALAPLGRDMLLEAVESLLGQRLNSLN